MWNWLATLVFHTYAVRSHEDHMAGQSEIRKAFYRAALEAGKEVKEDDEEEEGKMKRNRKDRRCRVSLLNSGAITLMMRLTTFCLVFGLHDLTFLLKTRLKILTKSFV